MRAFVVTVEPDDVDLASAVLWGIGVRAIEERDRLEPDGSATIDLWTSVGEGSDAIERATQALGGRWPHRVVDVAAAASDAWRDHAAPIWIDDTVVIVPAWQQWTAPDADASGSNESSDDALVVVRVEPGGAFGLGDHPTTRASLRSLLRAGVDGADVLDVGCGTGVIAVTAALLGARSVRAIDVAAAAVEATVDNSRRNGVGDVVVVDGTRLEDVRDEFDVVVANILAPTLIALADDLRRVIRPGGTLLISGVLADAHEHVLAALEPMTVERTDVDLGWACITLRH